MIGSTPGRPTLPSSHRKDQSRPDSGKERSKENNHHGVRRGATPVTHMNVKSELVFEKRAPPVGIRSAMTNINAQQARQGPGRSRGARINEAGTVPQTVNL